jgi:5-methyltetrahydropteroyltriglutamate--homocysteine methyltransferase
MPPRLFPTQEIGSLPRDRAFLNLIRQKPITPEQKTHILTWTKRIPIEDQPTYTQAIENPTSQEDRDRAKEYGVLFAIRFLEALGYDRVWNGEWPRTEMYDYDVEHVRGFRRLGWQESYDSRRYMKRALTSNLEYRDSEYYAEEFNFVQDHAKRQVKVPITDPHTIQTWSADHSILPRYLKEEKDWVLARLKAAREFTLEYARQITVNHIKRIARERKGSNSVIIQLDGPAAITQKNEYDQELLQRAGFSVPIYMEMLNETTPPMDGINYHVHSCLNHYRLWFLSILEVKRIEQFSIETANGDSDRPGTTDRERSGRGFEFIRLAKENGFKKKIGVGVASTFEGATAPKPEVVRDRILYAAKVLDNPEQVVATLDCGQRALNLDTAYDIGVAVNRGAQMARDAYESMYGYDAAQAVSE